LLLADDPVPMRPAVFKPQQYALPAAVVPQVYPDPAVSVTNVIPPATWLGPPHLRFDPLPNSPSTPSPQQYAAPPAVSAQVCCRPVVICLNLRPPATGIGIRLHATVRRHTVVVVAPNWLWSFAPQQYAKLSLRTAQV